MSKPIYIPLGPTPLEKVSSTLGIDWCQLDELTLERISAATKLILVAPSLERAEGAAEQLISRGVRQSQIEFTVLDNAGCAGPIQHMFWRDAQPLRRAPDGDSFKTYPSGIGFLDKNLAWRWRMRELMVVAGPYSSGKSTVLQQLVFNFIRTNGKELGDCGALICAWEDEAADMRRNLERFIAWAEYEYKQSYEYLLDRIHYVCRPADEERLIPWYIDMLEFYVRKYNAVFHTLDPWNEMDHKKDIRQIETDYIRDAMRLFRRVVDSNKIILGIATHVPAKMIRGDGAIEPFKIAHSFGSGNFGNKADRGLCIVRTKKFEATDGHTIWRLDKSKVEERMGHKGTVASRLDVKRFHFEYDADATHQVKDVWKD